LIFPIGWIGVVEHVEAHGGDIGQPGDAIHERAVLPGCLAGCAAPFHTRRQSAPAAIRHERKMLRPCEIGPQLTLRHCRLEVAAEQRRGIACLQVILCNVSG
jgi:hypothetical protein